MIIDNILLEDGFIILAENSDQLALEQESADTTGVSILPGMNSFSTSY